MKTAFKIAPLKMWTTLIEPLFIVELREKVERSRAALGVPLVIDSQARKLSLEPITRDAPRVVCSRSLPRRVTCNPALARSA